MSEDELKFEQALERLEKLVEKLEDGGLSLEKSLEKFTEGMKLIKFCNKKLTQAEEKIEIVLNEGEEYGEIVSYNDNEKNKGELFEG